MKWGTALLVSVLLAVLCPLHSASAAEPYKIGLILATTGKYGGMGTEDKLGATLAARKINESGGVNGHRIDLVFEDDEGDPGKGATAARKLISVEKVSAIFGSTSNIVSHAMALIAEDMKVPMIAPVPSLQVSRGKKFVFQNVAREEDTAAFMGRYVSAVGKWKKAGILNDGTEYGTDLASMLEAWLKKNGVAYVTAKFSPVATDVTPQWMSLRRENVDGAVVIGGPPAAPAVALKNRKQMGISVPVLCPSSLNNKKFLQLAGEAGEGTVLVSYFHYGKWPTGQADFINYITKTNPEVFPTLNHALGWDAVNLFATAMKKVGNDPVKIRDEIEKTTGYRGAVGEYNFGPANHSPVTMKSLVYVKVQGGKFVLIGE